MDDRLAEAIWFVEDRLTEDQLKIVKAMLDLNEDVYSGYRDWNDWEEYLNDKSEDGLEAYVCSLFGLEYTPVDEEEEDDE